MLRGARILKYSIGMKSGSFTRIPMRESGDSPKGVFY